MTIIWQWVPIMVALLCFSIAAVFIFPSREVTQPPRKMQVVPEILFPGTSPAWGYFGGLALVAWIYFLLQDLLIYWKGSPYILTMIAVPNLTRVYGIPVEVTVQETWRLINPSWVWVYLAPAVLFAVNLVLVFRAKIFRKEV